MENVKVSIVSPPTKRIVEAVCLICRHPNRLIVPVEQTSGDFECHNCKQKLHWEETDKGGD